jgi:hypothetical protein
MARKRRVGRPRKRRVKRKSKGHVPLTILKRRLKKLQAIVKRRGG